MTAEQSDAARGGWTDLTDRLPRPLDAAERDDVLWAMLDANFVWYNRHATQSRLGYVALKLVTLVSGAGVAALVTVVPAWVIAILGALVIVAEGLQQMGQLHANWISYRSSAETLRLHAVLYVARVAPYDDERTRRDHLAALVRDVTTREHTGWADTMKQSTARED